MAMFRALHLTVDWQVAEAALLCALPTPPLQAHAAALYRVAAPLPEHRTLRLLHSLSQRHVKLRTAAKDSEGAALNDLTQWHLPV